MTAARLPGRVLFIQHQDDCPAGYLGERARQRGLPVEILHAGHGPWPSPGGYGLVVSLGSYRSVCDDTVPYLSDEARLLDAAVGAGVPVLGVCFGAQLLARALGGGVRPLPGGPEVGWLRVDSDDPGLIEPGPWLVWHFDVMTTPPGGTEIARTGAGVQAFTCGPHVGVQFHPEATPQSVGRWARTYRDSLARLGIQPGELEAETRREGQAARARAYRLFDRVLDRTADYQAAARTAQPPAAAPAAPAGAPGPATA